MKMKEDLNMKSGLRIRKGKYWKLNLKMLGDNHLNHRHHNIIHKLNNKITSSLILRNLL